MIRRAALAVAALVLAGTVLVVVGVGQGSPPRQPPLGRAAQQREIAAVDHGSAQVRRGEQLFGAHGCDACHTIAAGGYSGRLGPRLDVASGHDALGEIEANIIAPPRDVPGFEAGLMPENFASRLPRRDLQALAAYIEVASHAAVGATGRGR